MKILKHPTLVLIYILTFGFTIIDGSIFNFDFFTLIARFNQGRAISLVIAFGLIISLIWHVFMYGFAKDLSGKKPNRVYMLSGVIGLLYVLFSAGMSNDVITIKWLNHTYNRINKIKIDSTGYKMAVEDLQFYLNKQDATGHSYRTSVKRARSELNRESARLDSIKIAGIMAINKSRNLGSNWIAKQVGWLVALMTPFISLLAVVYKMNIGFYKEAKDVIEEMAAAKAKGLDQPYSYDELEKITGKARATIYREIEKLAEKKRAEMMVERAEMVLKRNGTS